MPNDQRLKIKELSMIHHFLIFTRPASFVTVSLICFLAVVLFVTPLRAELIPVDNAAFQELLDQGVPVVDVRRAEEWTATGIVEGSHLMTFFDEQGRYDADQWLAQLKRTVDIDKPLILICHSGGRTSIIGKWLGKQLDAVYNVERGIVHWIVDNRETVAP